jgi:hypothetical protein
MLLNVMCNVLDNCTLQRVINRSSVVSRDAIGKKGWRELQMERDARLESGCVEATGLHRGESTPRYDSIDPRGRVWRDNPIVRNH